MLFLKRETQNPKSIGKWKLREKQANNSFKWEENNIEMKLVENYAK